MRKLPLDIPALGELLQAEAKVLVGGWRKEYNRFRPQSSLGYPAPAPELDIDIATGEKIT